MTVIVISLDTTRPDHLSAYGYDRETTPQLARLAAEGALFLNARTTAPWTLPSHMSLFTGQPVGVHDVTIDFRTLPTSRPTLGSLFKAGGFRTHGVFTAPYVHGRYGFARGMDFYERATRDPMIFDLPTERQRTELGARERLSHREVTSQRAVDRALGLLASSRAPRNLLFLHLFDPHYDYLAPAAYERRFTDPQYTGPVTGDAPTADPAVHAGMPAEDLDHLRGLYDAELAFVDDQLRRLLAGLEQQGRLDDTVLLITADHGEEFFEHGRFGHRAGLLDDVLRVPMLLWSPGRVPAGRVVEAPVSLVDVLPTLLDLCDLPVPPEVDGRSLRPLLEDGPWPPHPVTAALTFVPMDSRGYYEQQDALVIDSMKVIRTVRRSFSHADDRDLDGPVLPGSESFQAFDLAADPGETADLVAADDPRVPALKQALQAELDRQAARRQELGGASAAAQASDLTLTEILRGTGYAASEER